MTEREDRRSAGFDDPTVSGLLTAAGVTAVGLVAIAIAHLRRQRLVAPRRK